MSHLYYFSVLGFKCAFNKLTKFNMAPNKAVFTKNGGMLPLRLKFKNHWK